MLIILTQLLFILSSFSHSQMSCRAFFEKPVFASVADAFIDLASKKELLSQTHPRFKVQTGLCGFACATNILFSMRHFHGGDVEGFQYIAIGDVRGMVTKLGVGLEGGVTLEALENVLPQVANDIGGAEFYFDVKRSNEINEDSLQPSKTGLIIVAARWKEASGTPVGHALVVLKIDKAKQTLLIADPNFPLNTFEAGYVITSDGRFYIALPSAYSSKSANLDELMRLESRRRDHSPD